MISEAFKGTSRERLYKELGLKSLAQRKWFRKLNFFQEVLNGLAPSYLQPYLKNRTEPFFPTRSSRQSKYKSISTITKSVESYLHPYDLKEWDNLSEET